MRECCILPQATSGLHPERPEYPQTNYATLLHSVLGYRTPQLHEHLKRCSNTISFPDAPPLDLPLNHSSGRVTSPLGNLNGANLGKEGQVSVGAR